MAAITTVVVTGAPDLGGGLSPLDFGGGGGFESGGVERGTRDRNPELDSAPAPKPKPEPLGEVTVTAPRKAEPVPIPVVPVPRALPVTPLQELLDRPLRINPAPLQSPLDQLLDRPLTPRGPGPVVTPQSPTAPLGGVTVKGSRGGSAGGAVFGFLGRFLPLLLFPSPLGDQPDDPKEFGEKIRGRKPKPKPKPVEPRIDPGSLVDVVVKATKPKAPLADVLRLVDLVAVPRPGVLPVEAFRPRPQPKPKPKPEVKFEIEPRRVRAPLVQPVDAPELETAPLPSSRPAPSPSPRPAPTVQVIPVPTPGGATVPSPFPTTGAAGGAPPGELRCRCTRVRPDQKKRKKKKKPELEPAEMEFEYTQGKQKVKVEGKVEKLCLIRRVPIPKLTRRGIRKTRSVRTCF